MKKKKQKLRCKWCGKIKGEIYTNIHEKICRYNPSNKHCVTCKRGTDSTPCSDRNHPTKINRDCLRWEGKQTEFEHNLYVEELKVEK